MTKLNTTIRTSVLVERQLVSLTTVWEQRAPGRPVLVTRLAAMVVRESWPRTAAKLNMVTLDTSAAIEHNHALDCVKHTRAGSFIELKERIESALARLHRG